MKKLLYVFCFLTFGCDSERDCCEIINKITSSGFFIVSENLNSDKEIEKAFKRGVVREVIVFEPNFGENLIKNGSANIQLITDASDPNSANIVYSYTSAIINDYLKEININAEEPAMIIPQSQMRYNKDMARDHHN